MDSETRTSFDGWAILELMGHRRLGGYVTEVEIAGAAMLRLDVPKHPWRDGCTCGSENPTDIDHTEHAHVCQLFREEADTQIRDVLATQFYSPAALYCLTPTTEQMARIASEAARVEPVAEWEARWARPALTASVTDEHDDDPAF